MNIITGINKVRSQKSEVGSQKTEVKKPISNFQFPISKQLTFRRWAVLVFALIYASCAPKQPTAETTVSPKSDVKVSSPVIRSANRLVSYQGVTRYMQSNDIRSQVTGIVTQINCSAASRVSTNQALFAVQPIEAAALKKSKYGSQLTGSSTDTVFAHLSGQIKNLNVQVGDFVQAGDVLASCIRSNSMRIIVYIPVEQLAVVEKLKDCLVLLPDGSTIEGRISEKLLAAESQDQTQAYIVEPKKDITLAENINLMVQFTAENLRDAVFVPESAVLGNEEQTSFWIMKMINDSVCRKVQVEKGLKADSLVQVIGSALTIGDRVVSEGAYGLPDSARVNITLLINKPNPAANERKTSNRH